jgi:predicted CXXCH cytochrome family protein
MLLPVVHEPFAGRDCSACHEDIPASTGGAP